jgi:hypothetical protein
MPKNKATREKTPKTDFLAGLGRPARRALEQAKITTLTKLARYSESELLKLHGMGPSSLPRLRKALEAEGKKFRTASDSRSPATRDQK